MKLLWIEFYGEDAFNGAVVPYEWMDMIMELKDLSEKADRPIQIYENYAEYRDAEVEAASQAVDGSYGTTVYSDKQKFYDEHVKPLLKE